MRSINAPIRRAGLVAASLSALFTLVHCGDGGVSGDDPPLPVRAAATCGAQWDPTWQQGSGANNWWVEYAISAPAGDTVTSAYLEVVGDGETVPLEYRYNLKWVGPTDTRIATGAPVIVHATSALGQVAETQAFGYLSVRSPLTDCSQADAGALPDAAADASLDAGALPDAAADASPPDAAADASLPDAADDASVDAGTCQWNPTWQQGSGADEWWVEYAVSAPVGGTVSSVYLEVPGGPTVPLQYRYSSKWVGSSSARIPTGTPVVVHAQSSLGPSAQTQAFGYLSIRNPVTACAVSCVPSCTGRTCGDDGCGGSCGTCATGQTCTSGACTTAPPPSPVVYRGVNLSGAEFGTSVLPGTFDVDYTFPTSAEVDYYVGKGLTTFRIPFLWERLQPSALGSLDASYLSRLDAFVTYATGHGGNVVLSPYNFARYYGAVIGSSRVPNAVFADLWSKLATLYGSNPKVLFNLMNEPHDISSEQWVSAVNAAIAAIRSVRAANVILAPGNGWTEAATWDQSWYGTPNTTAMLKVTDPGNNLLFEAHEYFDDDGSGEGPCLSGTIGSERLAGFVQWLRSNGKKGFLGEFAGSTDSTCVAAFIDMLTTIQANADVLVGWLWWGGGPWWGSYDFALDPVNGRDAPQMAELAPFLR